MSSYHNSQISLNNFDSMNSKQMFVTKKDGTTEKVRFEKIQFRIEKLTYGLNEKYIDVAKIGMKVIEGLYSGITSHDIDNLAAETCFAMSTIHPDYAVLAARLFVTRLHKETDKNFFDVVSKLYKNINESTGEKMPIVNKRFFEDVKANKKVLNSAIIHDRDMSLTYFGLKTLAKSYLLKVGDKILERPQHLLMRVAVSLHGRNIEKVIETYEAMSNKYFIHATPTLFNAGTIREGLSSCFLLAATDEDDSIESIYDLLKECAIISKYSGGIGISVTDIRAKGSIIRSTNGKSEGIIPMIKVFNESATYVTQANKRPGSIAIYIEPWHAEIFDFLHLKESNGLEKMRARDLFYGLWIPDLFMEKVINNEEWCLFCPNEAPGLAKIYGDEFNELYKKYEEEGKYRKKVKAQDLFFAILDSQIKTGGPYMCYKDAANRKNNQKHIGTIRSSNLCTEIFQYTSHTETSVCNLGSIGLPSYIRYDINPEEQFTGEPTATPYFDFDLLYEKTKILARNLDKVIDITFYPVEKTKTSNLRHRPMGIGVSGLADTFMIMRYPFDSEEAKALNKKIFETIYYAAIEASCSLAEVNGPYETYEGSEFSKGKFQWNLWEDESNMKIEHSGKWDWEALKAKVLKYGMRNSLLTAPMPTASTSQIMGNFECIEPINSNIYKRETLSGEYIIVNKYLLKDLCELNLWNDAMKQQVIESKGNIQHIEIIPKHIRELYKTTWELKQKVLIDMSADRAPYIDQSQSLNLFVADPEISKLSSMHMYAYKKKLKTGLYYLKMKAATNPLQFSVNKNSMTENVVTDEKTNDDDDGIPVCNRNDPNCLTCSA